MVKVGSDQLYKRAKNNFARKTPTKSPRDRILIVCEGERDEPQFFTDLCNDKGLQLITDVKICGKECGSAPESIFKFANNELEKDINDSRFDNYDRAYCVFDRDGHESYEATLKNIKEHKKHKIGNRYVSIIAINSVPSFEFWILLHYKLSDKPFRNSKEIESEIKKFCSSYKKKSQKNIYSELKNKTETAIGNAKLVSKRAKNLSFYNPYTKIYILVEDLICQSKK